VLAEVEESSPARVDARLRKLGGMVFRRLRTEVIEDQLVRESAAFEQAESLRKFERSWAMQES